MKERVKEKGDGYRKFMKCALDCCLMFKSLQSSCLISIQKGTAPCCNKAMAPLII